MRSKLKQFLDAGFDGNFDRMVSSIKAIRDYQRTFGKDIVPTDSMVSIEIALNKASIFSRLVPVYLLSALVLFAVSLLHLLQQRRTTKALITSVLLWVVVLFVIHSAGIVFRWYVAGAAPLTNTYESIVYIAWSCVLASLVLLRRSLLALSASLSMAGIFMFAAHLNNIDPEITNLVPVLKSFWLLVHVSIITASYGFLGVGAMVGAMTLLAILIKPNVARTALPSLAAVNELSLTFGLMLLVIGNFLGAVWANESWGRYWGWDPKETWAYISIICYVIVLHLRMKREWDSPLILTIGSVVAFSSILMTYFGVNFYLTGLHSYATGDPVAIPIWVWLLVLGVVILISCSLVRSSLYTRRSVNR